MKIVVTGGSGLLGVAVVRELTQAGHQVINLDRKPHPDGHRISWVCDLLEPGNLYQACKGAEALIHLAAHIAPNLTSDFATFNENVAMTYNVLRVAEDVGVARVVIASSLASYGFLYGDADRTPDFLPLTEEHPLAPTDPYGMSKLAGEAAADSFARRGIKSIVSLRLPGINYDPTFERIRSFMKTPAYRKPGFWTYLDVRDAARAFRVAIENEGDGHRIYNVAAPASNMREPTKELVQRFFPTLTDIRTSEAGNWSGMDSSRAEAELGFRAEHVWERYLV